MSEANGHDDAADGLEAVAEAVVELRGQLEELRGLVEAGTPAAASGAAASYEAVVWAEVTSAAAAGVLREVAGWVEGVVAPTWPALRAELVPCWPRHGDLVQVLLDLHDAWSTSRAPSTRRLGLEWDMHLRYVPHAITVAQAALRACRSGGGHQDAVVKPPLAPTAAELDAAADEGRA